MISGDGDPSQKPIGSYRMFIDFPYVLNVLTKLVQQHSMNCTKPETDGWVKTRDFPKVFSG
jgi:hypothetical protein